MPEENKEEEQRRHIRSLFLLYRVYDRVVETILIGEEYIYFADRFLSLGIFQVTLR